MKLFGSLTELVSIVWRKNSQAVTLRPNQTTTYTASRDIQTPQQDTDSVLVSRTSTDTLTNKTLDNTNTVTLKDTLFTIQDDGDTTKQARFQASGITTGTTRTFTFPDADTTITGTDTTQTLSNKTVGLANGTVGAPSLNFTADADGTGTGIYRIGANNLGFSANGVASGDISSASVWTLGTVNSDIIHKINGNITASKGTADSDFIGVFDSSGTTRNSVIIFKQAGTAKADIGIAGSTSPFLTGAGTSDLVLLSSGNNILFTGDGSTIQGKLTSAGVWTLGPTAGAVAHVVQGTLSFNTTETTQAVNGLRRSATNTLALSTNSVDRITVDTSNVTSTLPYLSPSGSVTAPSFAFSADADGSGTGVYRVGANNLGFAANGVASGDISASALWTIGTVNTSVAHKVNGDLTVAKGTSDTDATIVYDSSGTTRNSVLIFKQNGTAKADIGVTGSTGSFVTGAGTSDFALVTASNNILFSGDNGSSIHGKMSSTGLWTLGKTNGAVTHVINGNITSTKGTDDSDWVGIMDSGGTTRNSYINFRQANSSKAFVGVAGSTSPIVTGAGTSDLTIISASNNTLFSGDNGSTIHAKMTSAGAWTLGATAGSSTVGFHVINGPTDVISTSSTAASQIMRLRKTLNSTATSNVLMDFGINATFSNSGQINANGANAAAFGSTSDSRLKENVTDLSGQLANIMALRPVEFDYIDGSGHQTGFIAQEIQTVYPEVVSEGGNGYLTVTGWDKTTARLVKALQELKQQFDAYVEAHP